MDPNEFQGFMDDRNYSLQLPGAKYKRLRILRAS